jgi:hypothetical protein
MIEVRDGERSFTYWRSQSAARLLASDPLWLDDRLCGAGLVLFSGITLANLRRRLWPDTATMCRELMRGAEVADVLLLSFEDKSGFVGDVTPKATIPRYRARRARTVIVKNGAAEIAAWDAEEGAAVARLPRVEAVDTTAAGNSSARPGRRSPRTGVPPRPRPGPIWNIWPTCRSVDLAMVPDRPCLAARHPPRTAAPDLGLGRPVSHPAAHLGRARPLAHGPNAMPSRRDERALDCEPLGARRSACRCASARSWRGRFRRSYPWRSVSSCRQYFRHRLPVPRQNVVEARRRHLRETAKRTGEPGVQADFVRR